MDHDFPEIAPFEWDQKRSDAAVLLASGNTHQSVADQVKVSKRTITNWLQHVEFSAEVDRLSLMVGIASRAERLRIAMRVVRQSVREETIVTEKDLLDWLKFAQSETDGIKLDLTKLSALGETDASVAVSGSHRESQSEAIH